MRKKYNKRKEGIILILIALGLLVGGAYVYSSKNLEARHPLEGEDQGIKNYSQDQNSLVRHPREGEDPGVEPLDSRSFTSNNVENKKENIEHRAILKFSDQTVEFSISNNTTVYDAMNALMSEGKISFEGREYPALGYFVTSIGSLESGDGKNLMYYINGKEASLGVSSYVVQEGDSIEWKLK
ncbi:MAG: hypothetical protein RLY49_53 [Candidatus Parcubacteria bacterium]|jgi:hypothetical protein